ncbi:MAG TPA: hypothetical protein PLH56_00945, partial [Candidatus Omnitrophota bacterium]|nr:hypothetical protein [Candidatus Omnitrophota bacterium]
MKLPKRYSKIREFLEKGIRLSLVFLFILGQTPIRAFAQYSGGSGSGATSSSLAGGVYTGGPEQGAVTSTSSSGSLSHGAAVKLVFTASPSTTAHYDKFSRQPVIEIRDVNNNRVSTDHSTQVTLSILNNPGAGTLQGTTTVRAVNGVVTFTDLRVTKAGAGYTLLATASGLTSATSNPFDILPGTGPKAMAIWDNTANSGDGGYTIYCWLQSNENKVDISESDTCEVVIYSSNRTPIERFSSIDSPS